MNNRIKLLGVIALLVIIGFSMVTCSSGVEGNYGSIYGCAYNTKANAEGIATWLNPPRTFTGTHYLLEITFDEAKANITRKLKRGN